MIHKCANQDICRIQLKDEEILELNKNWYIDIVACSSEYPIDWFDITIRKKKRKKKMRCEHCEYRNSWDCEDGYISNNKMCREFVLDFHTLTDSQKNEIQKRLMNEGKNYEVEDIYCW